ncbi:MAG: DUF3459 domain-containing protein, partial [Clostridiaceae bacterium]
MQWNASRNAGFSVGEPWIMPNPNYTAINAAHEETDADSVLHFYRALIALRNGSRTLQYGSFVPLWTEHEQLFAYERSQDGETFTIVCNMSGKEAQLPQIPSGERVLANMERENGETMLPYEARVVRMQNSNFSC